MKLQKKHLILLVATLCFLASSCHWSKTVEADTSLLEHVKAAKGVYEMLEEKYPDSTTDDDTIAVDSTPPAHDLQKEQSQLWNQLAQYLVGMRIDSTNIYHGLTQFPKWVTYQQKMWTMWNNYRKNAAKASIWTEQNITPLTTDCKQVLYAFSGPDWPYVHTFFPNADEYILLAAEPIGSIPQPNAYMNEEDAARLANALYHSTLNIWGNSFFVTCRMEKDLRNDEVDGVLPVLMMFMGREYRSIDNIEIGQLQPDGSIETESSKTPNVMRMEVSKKGKRQTITYIRCDLSNNGLKFDKPLCEFLENHLKPETSAGYLKAASYLPHYNNYSKIRNTILKKCRFILEDDSGIKYSDLRKAGFKCMFWGKYVKPIHTFKNCQQEDLDSAFKAVNPERLNFIIGYGRRSYQIGAIKSND